jgi:hypothetical protein
MGWVVKATPRPLYFQERDHVPIVYEAEWVPWPVLDEYGKSQIRSPDLPARSETLYRLSYTDQLYIYVHMFNFSLMKFTS